MRITAEMCRTWNACYSDERLAELCPPEGLTPQEVAALDIPVADRVWVLPRPEVLGERLGCVLDGIVERAIRRTLGRSGVPEWETWATAWLAGERGEAACDAAARAAAWAATMAAREAASDATWAATMAARSAREAANDATWAAREAARSARAAAWAAASDATWAAARAATRAARAAREAERDQQLADILAALA